jgi:hypothetical protein
MRIANCVASLTLAMTAIAGWNAQAQCQRGGGGSPGNLNTMASNVPYSQSGLNANYSLNSLSPTGYSQNPLATAQSMDQYNRNMRLMTAMQVQAQSQAVRSQVAQAQSMSKQIAKASAEKRKAAQQERAENLALREEREAARRAKKYDAERGTTRLTSLQ